MKADLKTTQLAFALTLIHIITRGLAYAFQIIEMPVDNAVYYLLLFVGEISYLLVIIYLILVIKLEKRKTLTIPFFLYLALDAVNFSLSIFYHPATQAEARSFSNILAGFSVVYLIAEAYMLVNTFRIKLPGLAVPFRFFAIAILFAHIFKTLIAVSITMWAAHQYVDVIKYSALLYLLPPLTVFFIIQKVYLLLTTNANTLN